jgi:flagellar motor switch protein FliM
VAVAPAAAALAALPETAYRFRVNLDGGPDFGLLVVPRPLLLTLLAALFNETLTEVPGERDLTPVEEALVDFVARQFFLDLLQECWGTSTPLALAVAQPEPARALGLLRPEDRLVTAAFGVQTGLGELEWFWMQPQAGWIDRLVSSGTSPATRLEPGEREALVRELPAPLSVVLGTAELSLLQMARLDVGDLIVLDGKVTEPLPVVLGGQVKLHAWPGAVGERQAVEIHSLAEG